MGSMKSIFATLRSPRLVLVVTGVIVADVMLAAEATKGWVLAVGVLSFLSGLVATSLAETGLRWLWVLVFLVIIPVTLAGFAWVRPVQSSGLPVGVYLYTLVSSMISRGSLFRDLRVGERSDE